MLAEYADGPAPEPEPEPLHPLLAPGRITLTGSVAPPERRDGSHRSWERGPQETLCLPWPLLRRGRNEVVVLELDGCGEPVVEVPDRPRLGRDRAAGGRHGTDQQPPQL